MPTRIPLPGTMMDALLRGADTGSKIYSNAMTPILEREKQKQQGEQFGITNKRQAEQFAQELALRKQAEARMGANTGLNRQLLQQQIFEHKLKTDPKALFQFVQQLKQQGANANPVQGNAQAPTQNQNEPMAPFSGMGMPSQDEIQNPTMPQQENAQNQGITESSTGNQQSGGLFDNLTPDQQVMLQMAGIKIPTIKENPEHKRYAELQNKLQLEQYKTQQKKALEQEKFNLKNEATRQKTIDSAKNDLPHLESTLEALQNMKKIATNNPDLFGHSGLFGFGAQGAAERFANTTENPNAGAWQTYGLGPIVEAESKMSSKGNLLALKQALANKANFSEHQKVAISKIDTSIKQIEKRIEENKKISGYKMSDSSGMTRVFYKGKSHLIPNSEVKAALSAGGSLNG